MHIATTQQCRAAGMGASVKTAIVEAPGLATDTMVGGCCGSGAAKPVPDLLHQPPGPVFFFVNKKVGVGINKEYPCKK